jgi:NAD(P)-dependent dehydrogenase (short-subunit alcohol dehydrogenase family)
VAGDSSSGRFVVLTGASSGIGRATVEELGRRGFRVLAGIRTDEDAERLAALDGLEPVRLDVLDSSAIDAAAERVRSLDVGGLVNNAGIAVTGPVETVPIEEWRRQLEVNLIGQVAVTRALLPSIIRSRGRVVNVTSIGGRLAGPLYGPYSASKFGMEAVTDVLRREVRALGVEVVAVEPGAVATPIWEKGLESAEAIVSAMPAAARERYGPFIEAGRKAARRNATEGVDPAQVAEVIGRALTARRPRTRYQVGTDARIGVALSRVLPDRALDAVTARMVGDRR